MRILERGLDFWIGSETFPTAARPATPYETRGHTLIVSSFIRLLLRTSVTGETRTPSKRKPRLKKHNPLILLLFQV